MCEFSFFVLEFINGKTLTEVKNYNKTLFFIVGKFAGSLDLALDVGFCFPEFYRKPSHTKSHGLIRTITIPSGCCVKMCFFRTYIPRYTYVIIESYRLEPQKKKFYKITRWVYKG